MIISHKYKFIFIKTRKTAGSSIEKYLSNYLGPDDICTGSDRDNTNRLNVHLLPSTNGHVGREFIQQNFPHEYKTYYKFSVERNPWDKMVSYYYWYKIIKPRYAKRGFDHFVLSSCHRLTDWKLYSEHDDICVDDVFMYENLQTQFEQQQKIPYNGELSSTFCKSGLREIKDYKTLFANQETIDKVAIVFENEIKYFGYKFTV